MSVLSAAIYDVLAADGALTALLGTYGGQPCIFTIDPVPGDAPMPYIVTAGDVVQAPFDTKTTRGRDVWRDVRCYTDTTGSAIVVESIAERVRALLHRQAIAIDDFDWILCECTGPIVIDEPDAYGRIVTAKFKVQED